MTDTENKNSLLQFLPYAGALLIVLGVIKHMIYYSAFGVNILNYLETGEIITSFLGDIIHIIVMLVVGRVFAEFIIKEQDYSVNICSDDNLLIRCAKYLNFAKWYFLCVFILASILCYLLWKNTEIFIMMIKLIAVLFISTFIIIILQGEHRYYKKNSSRKFPRYTIFLPTILFAIIGPTIREIERVKYDKLNTAIIVQIDSDTLISTPSYYYIGKTNKYIFFYDDSLGVAEIFPMERVKKIKLN